MKAEIHITGQINGNSALFNNICGGYERRSTMFYGYVIRYYTLKEARYELWQAYKELRKGSYSVDYSPKSWLKYDASYARIVKFLPDNSNSLI